MNQDFLDAIFLLLPIVFSLVITADLGVLIFLRRRVAGAYVFSLITLLESTWIFGNLLEVASPTLEGKLFWEKMQYIGTVFLPPMILIFALEYCRKETLKGLWRGLLFIIPILYLGLIVLNPGELLIQDFRLHPGYPLPYDTYQYGPLNQIGFVYSYSLLAVAIYFLARQVYRQHGIDRQQAWLVLIGILTPTLGTIMGLILPSNFPIRDFSPYSFAIGNLFVTLGVFRFGLFDIVTIGRDMVTKNMQEGVIILDTAGQLADINQAAAAYLELPSLPTPGHPVSKLPPAWADQLAASGNPPQRDIRMDGPQGELYFDLRVSDIINSHGQISGRLILIRDITARKRAELALQAAYTEMEQRVRERTTELSNSVARLEEEIEERQLTYDALRLSEARFKAIIEQSSEGFLLMDDQGKIIVSNPAMEKISGIPRSETIGQYAWEFQVSVAPPELRSDDLKERYRLAFFQLIHGNNPDRFSRPIETAFITPTGQQRMIRQTLFLIQMETGRRLGAIIRDVTLEKQAEINLQQMNAELEKRVAERTRELEITNRELDSFSYSVSHDLRAPLRAINGYAVALMEDEREALSASGKAFLDRILVNISQMDSLVNALLMLSRLDRQPLKRQTVQPGKLVNQAWDEIKGELKDQAVRLIVADLPDCSADPVLLKQVFVNLLSNAVKYTRPKPDPEIQVGCSSQDGQTVYWVKDNGVGFKMEHAEKLFGIFQRLHPEEQFEGIGIGLTIVQRIIERHGGKIWVSAQPDAGATFFFTLAEPAG